MLRIFLLPALGALEQFPFDRIPIKDERATDPSVRETTGVHLGAEPSNAYA